MNWLTFDWNAWLLDLQAALANLFGDNTGNETTETTGPSDNETTADDCDEPNLIDVDGTEAKVHGTECVDHFTVNATPESTQNVGVGSLPYGGPSAFGGNGDDRFEIIEGHNMRLDGGDGNDEFYNFHDFIIPNSSNNWDEDQEFALIFGGSGEDTVKNYGMLDQVELGRGVDDYFGASDSHATLVDLGAGNDTMTGFSEWVTGGEGDDIINITPGLSADNESFNFWYSPFEAKIYGDEGNDTIDIHKDAPVEAVYGGDGLDTVVLHGGNVKLVDGGSNYAEDVPYPAQVDILDLTNTDAVSYNNAFFTENTVVFDDGSEHTWESNKDLKKIVDNNEDLEVIGIYEAGDVNPDKKVVLFEDGSTTTAVNFETILMPGKKKSAEEEGNSESTSIADMAPEDLIAMLSTGEIEDSPIFNDDGDEIDLSLLMA